MLEIVLVVVCVVDVDIVCGYYEGVLYGVLIGVKDFCYMVDVLIVVGIIIFCDFCLVYDVMVVVRLCVVGVVIIGKLVMMEGVYFGYYFSLLILVNFWDLIVWVGVFLSGCGVVIVVGLCFGLIGLDIGGLICFLMSMCGVIGIKLMWGWVSCYGVVEFVVSYDYVGLIICSVYDVVVLFSVIVGFDIYDFLCLVEFVLDYVVDFVLIWILCVGVDWLQMMLFDEDIMVMLVDVVKMFDDIGWFVIDVKLFVFVLMVVVFGKMCVVEMVIVYVDIYLVCVDEYGLIMCVMIDVGYRLVVVEYQMLIEWCLEFM